ncbi:MAG: hypothetical protein ABSG32_21985 [Terriglobia bacterium]|jgi:hypothetical protein
MKHTLLAAVLLLVSPYLTLGQSEPRSKPKDVNGWTKASWGMTREEIMEAFPGTHPSKAVLVSAPFKIGNDRFNAEFNFAVNSKLLDVVIISPMDEILLPDDLFQRLELMLTEKYGSPTTRADPSLPDKEIISTSWAFPSTIISLNRISMHGPIPENTVTISYLKNPSRKGADNL